MKRSIRIIIAIILIIIFISIWFVLGEILFGWKHGGGAIPMVILFSLVVFIWRIITKKTPKEKGGNQDIDSKNDTFDEG